MSREAVRAQAYSAVKRWLRSLTACGSRDRFEKYLPRFLEECSGDLMRTAAGLGCLNFLIPLAISPSCVQRFKLPSNAKIAS